MSAVVELCLPLHLYHISLIIKIKIILKNQGHIKTDFLSTSLWYVCWNRSSLLFSSLLKGSSRGWRFFTVMYEKLLNVFDET